MRSRIYLFERVARRDGEAKMTLGDVGQQHRAQAAPSLRGMTRADSVGVVMDAIESGRAKVARFVPPRRLLACPVSAARDDYRRTFVPLCVILCETDLVSPIATRTSSPRPSPARRARSRSGSQPFVVTSGLQSAILDRSYRTCYSFARWNAVVQARAQVGSRPQVPNLRPKGDRDSVRNSVELPHYRLPSRLSRSSGGEGRPAARGAPESSWIFPRRGVCTIGRHWPAADRAGDRATTAHGYLLADFARGLLERRAVCGGYRTGHRGLDASTSKRRG